MRKTLVPTIAVALSLALVWVAQARQSRKAPPPQGARILVTSAEDTGQGTLRDALERAAAGTTITFDPLAFPLDNPTTILVIDGQLPTITQGDLTIDASGAGVILDGSPLSGDEIGLRITSDGNVIKGLQILNFPINGISLLEGASNNLIGGSNATPGGPCTGDCNVISGSFDGVNIAGTGTMSNVVSGNYIGTDASGTVALGSAVDGVWVGMGAQGNRIGGDTPGERNVISGNGNSGLVLDGVESCTITGNYVGTDASGTVALGNGNHGITLASAQGNVVGGDRLGARNLVAGNAGSGVNIVESSGNTISGNYIGTDLTGTEPLGNAGAGIYLAEGASDNLVGPRNVVAYNAEDGIRVQGQDSLRNSLTRNSVYQNAGLGISLLDGGNAGLEPPVIGRLSARHVKGSAAPGSTIEVFYDEAEQGGRFVSTTTVDREGTFSFATAQGTLEGPRVTCTATDVDGNTSQFSEAQPLPKPAPFRAPPYLVGPTQLSRKPDVVGTNAVLAFLCAVFFGVTSTIFNSVLEEYVVEIESAWLRFVPGGLRPLRDRLQRALGQLTRRRTTLMTAWAVLMLVTAVIESFLDPELPLFSPTRLYLIFTLFIAALIVGGLEVISDLFTRRQLTPETDVQVRLNVVGILIAGACVLLSRGLSFKPGYLYGTVGALYLIPEFIGRVRTGKRALLVLGAIFAGGLAFWGVSALLPPGLAGLEALFLTIFLIAVQGVFFELLPLGVTEGGYLFRWRRWIWLFSTALVMFVVFASVLNPHASAVEALRQNGVIILLVLLAVYGLATLGLYLLFPVRLGRPGKVQVPAAAQTEDAVPWTRDRLAAAIAAQASPEDLDLAGADLSHLDLSSMDLHCIILSRLEDAMRVSANLEGVDLTSANLKGAAVTPQQLSQADCLRAATLPDGTQLSEEDWETEFAVWRRQREEQRGDTSSQSPL